MKKDASKGMSKGWGPKQRAMFERAKKVCYDMPWLYMRKDALCSYYKKITGQNLTLDTKEAYNRMGTKIHVFSGIHFAYFPWKRDQLRSAKSTLSLETRLQHLIMPAKYPFLVITQLYHHAYEEHVSTDDLRIYMSKLWGPPVAGDKYNITGHQASTRFSDVASNVGTCQNPDFISLKLDSDSESVLSSLSESTSSYAFTSAIKRPRTDDDMSDDSMLQSTRFQVRVKHPPPRILLPTTATIPIRKLLKALRERAIAQGKHPGPSAIKYRDLTRPVQPRDGSMRRLCAADYFDLDERVNAP